MFNRVNYTLVGLFVVVLGITLVAAGLWFSADISQEEQKYFLVYPEESLTGLSRNSSVKFQGIDVGRVRELGLDEQGRVRVLISVEENVPVREDTKVRLASQGLTGLGHLELIPGDPDAPAPRADEHPHPVLPNAPSLRSRLEQAVEDGLASIERMGERMETLLSEDNIRGLTRTMANIERISESLAENSEHLNQTLTETEALIRDTRTLVNAAPETLTRIQQSLDRFDAAVGSVRTVADDLQATQAQGSRTLERVNRETLPELNRTLTDVQDVTRTLDRFSQGLIDHPSQLIFGGPRRPPGPGEDNEARE